MLCGAGRDRPPRFPQRCSCHGPCPPSYPAGTEQQAVVHPTEAGNLWVPHHCHPPSWEKAEVEGREHVSRRRASLPIRLPSAALLAGSPSAPSFAPWPPRPAQTHSRLCLGQRPCTGARSAAAGASGCGAAWLRWDPRCTGSAGFNYPSSPDNPWPVAARGSRRATRLSRHKSSHMGLPSFM